MVNWIIAIAICQLAIEILIITIIITLATIKDCVEEIKLSNQNAKKLDKIERIVQFEVGDRHDIERMVLEVIRGGR